MFCAEEALQEWAIEAHLKVKQTGQFNYQKAQN